MASFLRSLVGKAQIGTSLTTDEGVKGTPPQSEESESTSSKRALNLEEMQRTQTPRIGMKDAIGKTSSFHLKHSLMSEKRGY